jgi:alkylation response protein AidB-like acyl-CoA dehydrogenase
MPANGAVESSLEGAHMRASFTEEQEELRQTVRRFLAEQSPPAQVRRSMETVDGFDPAVWDRLARELGLCGVHIPEQYGGQGATFEELCIVLEEMGRALFCAPYMSSVAHAATAILIAGTEARRKELLPRLACGELRATLALAEPGGTFAPADMRMTATPERGGFRLDGVKTLVADGHTADLLLVAARVPDSAGLHGLSLFLVPGDAEGLVRQPHTVLDSTRKLARVELRSVRAALLSELGGAGPTLAAILDRAAIALACESVGGAACALEMAVDYAKVRVQFGRPIGSFQAIKHRCADLLVDVELAKSAAYYAAAAAAEDDADVPALASLAKALASDAYMHAAAENIQIHGGIGFTWEHDAHLYFKRAKGSEVWLGDPTYHRELYAQRIGL